MPAACFCQSIDLDEIFNMYATDKNLQNVLFEFSVQTKIKKNCKGCVVLFLFLFFQFWPIAAFSKSVLHDI